MPLQDMAMEGSTAPATDRLHQVSRNSWLRTDIRAVPVTVQMPLVQNRTKPFSQKNSFIITLRTAYAGTATIIPIMPNRSPAAIMITKISMGCDFILLE